MYGEERLGPSGRRRWRRWGSAETGSQGPTRRIGAQIRSRVALAWRWGRCSWWSRRGTEGKCSGGPVLGDTVGRRSCTDARRWLGFLPFPFLVVVVCGVREGRSWWFGWARVVMVVALVGGWAMLGGTIGEEAVFC
ncbi:proline-rich receptor-like protein kinase PERK9 [Iris pallida]|uniref:Proline-rich receptor-like protein kinase PERK9 n=1 Tax=Iris pallida TaxID=29817 RepID=A0AAX6F0T1_IRIPA|nr:proline-rich receptor-like protein kinase PERK9 [Iris pallida]